MNKKFGKLENGVIVYAPKFLNRNDGIVLNPTKDLYLADGWKEIVDVRPAVDVYHSARATGWNEDTNTITRTYELIEVKRTARKWTPLSIKRAADAKGWWKQLREALVAADLLEDFWGAQYIAEDDPQFPAIKAGMVALFGEGPVHAFITQLPRENS